MRNHVNFKNGRLTMIVSNIIEKDGLTLAEIDSSKATLEACLIELAAKRDEIV